MCVCMCMHMPAPPPSPYRKDWGEGGQGGRRGESHGGKQHCPVPVLALAGFAPALASSPPLASHHLEGLEARGQTWLCHWVGGDGDPGTPVPTPPGPASGGGWCRTELLLVQGARVGVEVPSTAHILGGIEGLCPQICVG